MSLSSSSSTDGVAELPLGFIPSTDNKHAVTKIIQNGEDSYLLTVVFTENTTNEEKHEILDRFSTETTSKLAHVAKTLKLGEESSILPEEIPLQPQKISPQANSKIKEKHILTGLEINNDTKLTGIFKKVHAQNPTAETIKRIYQDDELTTITTNLSPPENQHNQTIKNIIEEISRQIYQPKPVATPAGALHIRIPDSTSTPACTAQVSAAGIKSLQVEKIDPPSGKPLKRVISKLKPPEYKKLRDNAIKAFTDYRCTYNGNILGREETINKVNEILGSEIAISALFKGCDTKNSTITARTEFLDYIFDKEKTVGKIENTIEGLPLNLKGLGKKGLKLFHAAKEEERNDMYFRAAVFLNSYSEAQRTPPKKPQIILITGPSSSGKSTLISQVKEDVNLIPLNNNANGNVVINSKCQFIEVDASIERGLSRVTKIALDYADRQGYKGIKKIHGGPKIKGYLKHAAMELMKTKNICMVVPLTFARQGVIKALSGFFIRFSPVTEYLKFAKENEADIVCAEIHGRGGQQFRAAVKLAGDQRAWTPDFTEVKGDYDLYRTGRQESKDYDADNFGVGKKGSRAAGEYLKKLAAKSGDVTVRYKSYTNDLAPTYLKNNILTTRSDSDSIQKTDVILSERNMLIWKALAQNNQGGEETIALVKEGLPEAEKDPSNTDKTVNDIIIQLAKHVNAKDLKEFASCCYRNKINKNHKEDVTGRNDWRSFTKGH